MQNNHCDLLCAATGGFCILLSFSVMFYSLLKWCRSRNNQSQTTTCHSAEVQCANISTIIPVIVYERDALTMCEYDHECSICLAEFEEGERLRVLPNCKHVFHVVCIDQWIPVRSLNCPVCRDRTIRNDSEPVSTACDNGNNLSSAFAVVNFGMNRL